MKTGRLIAHIPARGGSKRVPEKNLRLLRGRPMISYAIEAAMASEVLDDVYVNTDSERIAAFAETMGCKVFLRSPNLASDTATGDDFTYDFICKMNTDTLMLVNPVCPLIKAEDIKEAVNTYSVCSADTLIACTETHMQVFCENLPVNITPAGPLRPSQENPAVYVCSWAIALWNCSVYKKNYENYRGGYFGTERVFFPLPDWKSVKVSVEKDFVMAEKLLAAEEIENGQRKVEYWTP